MSTDVGRDPTVEQHQVNVLMEVSSPTVRLLKEELGRGPMGAPTQLAETDAFLGILDGALTSAERTRREPRPQLSPSAPVPAPAPWSDAPARTQRRARTPNLTVVVPTRDEAANVGRLLRELGDALTGEDAEVLFVDDSDDETPDVIREHVGGDLPVALLHRAPGERDGGLGGAVAEGLRAAKGRFVCVMDGDLQHPPQLVRKLLAEAETSGADVVVASRYVEQGDLGQFGALRRAVSRASTTLARAAFPRRLRGPIR
jgi:dolichol-phosphate mannosyltransferase